MGFLGEVLRRFLLRSIFWGYCIDDRVAVWVRLMARFCCYRVDFMYYVFFVFRFYGIWVEFIGFFDVVE